ncbi:LIC12162 family transferase [Dechloromonas denitrificans]|uniref:LIC12162 family transferase n=1 Tax=Dechloromonas denitrificans TaxID=281362 RepID=UPI001CFACB8F|nr:LIC12162 family protein [Dechloromonas denitrificans]UCV06686.1 LIC12162 family protein [Dechloromonas denitrificans]
MSPVKSNFAVSAYTQIWHPDTKRIFAIDAYIPHVLERTGVRQRYDIASAPPSRSSREEFDRDHDFVDRKFHLYTDILCKRLDELHRTDYGSEFWRKAMALALMRHVTFCYDLFKACEAYFDPEAYTCRLLDPVEFRTPNDFDEHRQIFQNTELGQEQLFSVYCSLFYPGMFDFWKPEPSSDSLVGSQVKAATPSRGWSLFARMSVMASAPYQFATKLVQKLFTLCKPRMAIIECSFAPEHVHRLLLRSLGQIQAQALPSMQYENGQPDWGRRDFLCRNEPDFDRFDRFAFACLKHAFPRLFIEDFARAYARIDAYFGERPTLHWIVCEWWIGSNWSAFAMAVAKRRGIRHLCNEHNYLSYFFVGNNLKYLACLVDEFVTLGWSDARFPNTTKGASLFPWGQAEFNNAKEHDILLICGLPLAHVPEVTSAYGDSGAYRALAYFAMNKRFFAALDEAARKSVYFRSYPAALTKNWLIWDQTYALAEEIAQVKRFDDSIGNSRKLMKKSRLVVVNYLSTSYLEAIIADIPTIVIWNPDTNLFSEQYSQAFDSLIEAGICQTDPEDAAVLVNSIREDPEAWWQSSAVRWGRQEFLNANIGNPEIMVDYLLSKLH